MMKIYEELRYWKKMLGLDDWDVEFERVRGKYPDAGVYPNLKKIIIYGNPTSLARYGLIEILLHEKTHIVLREEGYENWDKHDEIFWKKYNELRKDYEDLVNVHKV